MGAAHNGGLMARTGTMVSRPPLLPPQQKDDGGHGKGTQQNTEPEQVDCIADWRTSPVGARDLVRILNPVQGIVAEP